MPLESDIRIDAAKFAPAAVTDATHKTNEHIIDIGNKGPKWYEVGAAKYREMRYKGETPLPATVLDPRGKKSSIPSRDTGREIPVRIFEPLDGKPRGVFMHIHGGGWVLQSEESQDVFLKAMCDNSNVTVVSVGYRLAPEYPYPAAPNDCIDAAHYLVDQGEARFGAPLKFIGGESAGGHLSAVTLLHLIESRPMFSFKAATLHFGGFDVSSPLPGRIHFDLPLVLTNDIMDKYVDAFLPGTTDVSRRDPAISPFYANLPLLAQKTKEGKLPPVLFTCGTADVLLDDTVFFGTKWAMSGAESIIKIYPGAPHGYIFYPPGTYQATDEGVAAVKTFLDEHM